MKKQLVELCGSRWDVTLSKLIGISSRFALVINLYGVIGISYHEIFDIVIGLFNRVSVDHVGRLQQQVP